MFHAVVGACSGGAIVHAVFFMTFFVCSKILQQYGNCGTRMRTEAHAHARTRRYTEKAHARTHLDYADRLFDTCVLRTWMSKSVSWIREKHLPIVHEKSKRTVTRFVRIVAWHVLCNAHIAPELLPAWTNLLPAWTRHDITTASPQKRLASCGNEFRVIILLLSIDMQPISTWRITCSSCVT